ncbi:MAG: thioredoxin domain-containing protein [Bacteroidota bacterium]|jgi:uncharacterized protein YyaL (SSP411 family)
MSLQKEPHSGKPNRLLREKSPYLLQHAYNPVDWYPWGEEAFEKARREEKPIFLSIGYSTCYWCHVMEREVFENESIAALMNQTVVPIKVDREERPDIDRIYMSALQAMNGSGGWPMSMFLTPDLKPFFGATYIPPVENYGRPGFPQILTTIHEVWTTDRVKVIEAAGKANDYLIRLSSQEGESIDPDIKALESGFQAFQKSYDERNAGFGGAPKFPRPVALNFLLRYYARKKNLFALEMSLTTLRRMANGGMYDHVGGGFHRYSTDERWHAPHFEKMLYDQAQLTVSYLEAYQITHDKFFSKVAEDTLEYVLRDLTHPDGGFYSAEDAESAPDHSYPTRKEEGAFYVWTKSEIEKILTPEESKIWCWYCGVEDNGNVTDDPHGVFGGKNILYLVHTPAEVSQQLALSEEQGKKLLTSARQKLFAERNKRPRCHLDDKILASWNGLMISALARAYQVLGDIRYLEAAGKSAGFILTRMRNESTGELYHRYREGEARFEGQLDDYAFLLQALIDLYEASFNVEWLTQALRLAEDQNRLFYDHEKGGFFDTAGRDPSILVRTKEWYDGAEPSGNSIAILNLLRLAQFTSSQELETKARKSFLHFGERMSNAGQAMPQMLVALSFSLSKPKQIILAGEAGDPHTLKLLREVHSHFVPEKVLMLADGGKGESDLSIFIPLIHSMKKVDGWSTAYVCENYACQLPTSDPSELSRILGS